MSEARCRQQWQHTSALMALLVNINSDPKKTTPAKPSDFNPYEQSRASEKPTRRMSVKGLKGMFQKQNQRGKKRLIGEIKTIVVPEGYGKDFGKKKES